MLSAKEVEAQVRARDGRVTPGDRVGAVPAGDRVFPHYSGGREPVTYGRGSLWIVLGVVIILFVVFFGFLILSAMWG
ncbi:MAG TPA: hypothetical protein VI915_00965 [Thermoplasmata archaeon]|nr:hypothetical protein [Thermoplasmata archaeon]